MSLVKKSLRESYLLNMLKSMGQITTNNAMEMLDVSEATARRLFAEMERSGAAVRSYGGIRLAPRTMNYSFELNERVYSQEKQRIGRMAAEFVEDGDTIYLDCGTTVFQMTLALSDRIAEWQFGSLNIVTNSIANVQAITPSPRCRVILVGGEYDSARRDFSGPLTEKYIAPFHFTKSFFGCDGTSPKMGFSSNQVNISSLNTHVMERSDFTCVLLDSSKLNKCSLVTYARLEDVNAIVTDREPEGEIKTALDDAGVRVNVANLE
jgi:DeoR/GlpR family transcriptional regulator of sugar metabolism